jgi:hypothetical protein
VPVATVPQHKQPQENASRCSAESLTSMDQLIETLLLSALLIDTQVFGFS